MGARSRPRRLRRLALGVAIGLSSGSLLAPSAGAAQGTGPTATALQSYVAVTAESVQEIQHLLTINATPIQLGTDRAERVTGHHGRAA